VIEFGAVVLMYLLGLKLHRSLVKRAWLDMVETHKNAGSLDVLVVKLLVPKSLSKIEVVCYEVRYRIHLPSLTVAGEHA
jgi:hypothetical protein